MLSLSFVGIYVYGWHTSLVDVVRYPNCGRPLQSAAFDSSSSLDRIPINYPCRSHFSDVELRTVLTYGTSTFHAIAFKRFEWKNSAALSATCTPLGLRLFISETGISHQHPDVCGSLTFMSLFYFLLHGRPTCYRKGTIARSWLRYRIASCTFSRSIWHSWNCTLFYKQHRSCHLSKRMRGDILTSLLFWIFVIKESLDLKNFKEI